MASFNYQLFAKDLLIEMEQRKAPDFLKQWLSIQVKGNEGPYKEEYRREGFSEIIERRYKDTSLQGSVHTALRIWHLYKSLDDITCEVASTKEQQVDDKLDLFVRCGDIRWSEQHKTGRRNSANFNQIMLHAQWFQGRSDLVSSIDIDNSCFYTFHRAKWKNAYGTLPCVSASSGNGSLWIQEADFYKHGGDIEKFHPLIKSAVWNCLPF